MEKVARLCRENDIPAMMAFCLERIDKGDGKMQMVVAGNANLGLELDPPDPMVFAASMLRIPGFEPGFQGEMEEE